MAWPIEDIPDADNLFMRVLSDHILEDGDLKDAAFQDRNGMSTNWEKYATAAQTRHSQGRRPTSDYAVIALNAGAVRGLRPLRVQHSPIEPNQDLPGGNQAHTDILGLGEVSSRDRTALRVHLRRLHRLVIALRDPVEE